MLELKKTNLVGFKVLVDGRSLPLEQVRWYIKSYAYVHKHATLLNIS